MKNLDKTLDDLFSIYIRLKYTNDNGQGNCYTCDEPATYFLGQCGHFIKRGHQLYRTDKNNARLQCKDCNEFKSGNLEIYQDRLIDEIGIVKVAEMKFKSNQDFAGWSKSEKKEMVKALRSEAKELLKDKNFNITIP